MINLRIIIVLASVSFFSCNKQIEVDETTNAQSEIQAGSDQNSKSLLLESELERVFKNLDETNIALGSMVLDQPFVALYALGDPFTEPMPDPILGTDKKFKFNFWGIREAVNYAGDIMQEGGCIKAWLDDDNMINVEEIPC